MRKFTLLFLALLGAVGAKAQGEYVAYQPTAPVTVSWEDGGNQPSYAGSYFRVSKGDVIKVHVTNVSSSNYQPKVIWRGAGGSDWNQLDAVTTTDGEFSYTIESDEIATSINQHGIALSGIGYNMLDITVQTNNATTTGQTIVSSAKDLGTKWGVQLDLFGAGFDYSKVKVGDVINIAYTTYSTIGENWGGVALQSTSDYKNITDACGVSFQAESQTTTLSVIVDSKILSELQDGRAIIKGAYATVNSVSIASDNKAYTRTFANTETNMGTGWGPSIEMKNLTTDYAGVKVGDVLAIKYTTDTSSSGEVQLQYNWQKLDGFHYTGLAANTSGTLNISITSDLLAKLNEDEKDKIQIKGQNVTIPANGVSIIHVVPTPGYRPVYIPASGYATFYGESTCALPAGVEAYYVSQTTSETAKLTSISNIPANEGVILHGAQGIYQLYTTDDDDANVSGNKLVGSTTRTNITSELAASAYMLYNNSGSPEFRKMTEGSKLDAYKCYLNTAGAGARLSIVFDDSETAINTVEAQGRHALDDGYYTLSGQRVEQPTKGLYIKNGKKYIIK